MAFSVPLRIQDDKNRSSDYIYAQAPLIETSFLHAHGSTSPNHFVLLDSSPSQANNHFAQDEVLYRNKSKKPSSLCELNSVSSIKHDNEKVKRKRSRVSAEQLDRLERYFATDTNPTTAQRCEISLSLGMEERQTQIWFQNRRAKARLQKAKRKQSKSVSPSCSPLLDDTELRDVILEDAPFTVIPCTDIIIGSWRRTATSENKNDLIVYMCEEKQSVCWFVHSGRSFKMEISYKIIADATFTRSSYNEGVAVLALSEPPMFFLDEEVEKGSLLRQWVRCPDWTQGREASRILSHRIVGLANPLSKIIQTIRAFNHSITLPNDSLTARNDIALYSPTSQPQDISGNVYPDLKPVQSKPFSIAPDFDRDNVYSHHFQGTGLIPNSVQSIMPLPNNTFSTTDFRSGLVEDYCEVPISVSYSSFSPHIFMQAIQRTSGPLSWSCDIPGPSPDQISSTSASLSDPAQYSKLPEPGNYMNVSLSRPSPALSPHTYLWG